MVVIDGLETLEGKVEVEQSPADEPAQLAPADPGLNRGDIGPAQGGQLAGNT